MPPLCVPAVFPSNPQLWQQEKKKKKFLTQWLLHNAGRRLWSFLFSWAGNVSAQQRVYTRKHGCILTLILINTENTNRYTLMQGFFPGCILAKWKQERDQLTQRNWGWVRVAQTSVDVRKHYRDAVTQNWVSLDGSISRGEQYWDWSADGKQ